MDAAPRRSRRGADGGRGHAVRPHTADAVIEAWGPSAAACYEEAVAAFVALFADPADRTPESTRRFDIGPGPPPDLLVRLLEEVLFEVEVLALVPVATHVEVRGDRLAGTFAVVPSRAGESAGAVPKGVSYEELTFGPVGGQWRCRAVVDV